MYEFHSYNECIKQFIIFQKHRMCFFIVFCNKKHQIRKVFDTFIEKQKL